MRVYIIGNDGYTQGDAAAGEKVFAHCAPCHSNKPCENKFGPLLAGVFDRLPRS
jgi:cytochrome c